MKINFRVNCFSTCLLVMTCVPCMASQATVAPASRTSTTTMKDRDSVLAILSVYETALNTANAKLASDLYADDAVVMPPGQEPVVGKRDIRELYGKGSRLLKFNVKFTVIEVVPLCSDWAFARTSSSGTITVLPSETISAEANQELFIFHKIGSAWKIARYSFSSMKDPQMQK